MHATIIFPACKLLPKFAIEQSCGHFSKLLGARLVIVNGMLGYQGSFTINEAGMCEWGIGGMAPLIFSNLPESWSKVSHAGRELATALSVTLFLFFGSNSWSIGQNAPPPNGECLGTALA